MIEVTLQWFEVSAATHIANLRRTEQIRNDRFRPTFSPRDDEWTTEQDGACAEMAVAKFLGTYWSGSVNSFKLPDLRNVQVRHTSRSSGRLIVRQNDSDLDVYVLVTGTAPTFRVHGGIRGRDAKRDEWLSDPNGRGPAWFVPPEALGDLTKLVSYEEAAA